MPSEVNSNLRQHGRFGVRREYQIVDGRNLRLAIGKKSNIKVYQIPILALAEKSRRQLHIAWRWVWLSIFGLVGMPVYFQLMSLLGINAGRYNSLVVVGLSVVVLLGLVMVALNFSHKRVFYTAFSKVPVFDILVGNPDRRSYKQFMQDFEMYLKKTRGFMDLDSDKQAAGEMRMLRRLASDGLIPQKYYESAKGKMFKLNNARAKATS